MADTKRLSVPTNPARALRELNRQSSDADEPLPPVPDVNPSPEPLSRVQFAPNLPIPAQDAPLEWKAQEHNSLLASQQVNKLANKLTSQPTSRTEPSVLGPIDVAILEALARPYPREDKPARELVAARLRRETAERLTLACTLLKHDKQDVIDKALEMFLAQLVASDGEIEW